MPTSKVRVLARKIQFLGHIVTKEGISVDLAKVEAIMNRPKPTNVSEVRSFLGIAGYYRRFMEEFSKLALPITKLVRKSNQFEWTRECEDSFQELKRRPVSAPILIIPEGNEGCNLQWCIQERIGICSNAKGQSYCLHLLPIEAI